jgi:segregation and condensation protein A
MFKLLDALETVFERVRRTEDHLVDFERISISDRINQLSDILQRRHVLVFHELFDGDRTRADVIVTFLALLEMTRLRLTRIYQDHPYEPIRIELAVQEDTGAEETPERAEAPDESSAPSDDARPEPDPDPSS